MKKKQSTKGKYQRTIANPKLAKAMDILADRYRIKEKFFPIRVCYMYRNKQSDIMEYATLKEMALDVSESEWFGREGSSIKRIDETGLVLKTHVYREKE